MNIRFGDMCRGDGNVYVRVLVEGVAEGCLFRASASVKGTSLPARVLPCPGLPGLGLVAAVSVLNVSQTLSVIIENADGRKLGQSSVRIDPRVAKLRSKFATVRKNPEVELMRGFDAVPIPGEAFVAVERLIDDGEFEIVSGFVELSADNPPNLAVSYDVVCLDRTGRRVDTGWVCMGDSCKPSKVLEECRLRTISFSMRIPAGLREFTIWAQASEVGAWSGFRSVEWFVVEGMRADWRRRVGVSVSSDLGYEPWFLRHHRADSNVLAAQRRHEFACAPLFSVVVPLYRTPLDFFEDMAASVLGQTYGRFELILVNASPEDGELGEAVEQLAQQDNRVRVIELEGNRGIAENTNEGIRAATGDFVCFLDHDDLLEPDALFEYARALNEHDGIDLIYCDEDKYSEGHYCGVYLKPDFSPDLLLGVNYICHFLACRREVLLQTGFTPTEMDGAQDYDATWRVIEQGGRVWHVRRVLYHWRAHPNSTAGVVGQKSYAQEAGRLAVQRHLDRCGIKATVRNHPRVTYHYEIEYDLGDWPLVSIIIPNKDGIDLLDRCLRSIRDKTTYSRYEVVIVENNSTDAETFAYYKRVQASDARVRVVVSPEKGFNFSRVSNAGVRAARGERLVFLNNDVEVIEPRWIELMLGPTMRPEVAAVGALLLFPDDTIQHAGVVYAMPFPGHTCHRLPIDLYERRDLEAQPFNVSISTAACLMVTRTAFEKIGGFDEGFAVDFNDVDFCLRLRSEGYHIVLNPRVRLYHYESASRGRAVAYMDDEKVRFQKEGARLNARWASYCGAGDPLYHPLMNRAVDNLYYRF